MSEDLEIVGAYLWRQLGHRPATANQAEGALSYELHLFKPSEAKVVLEALVARGLFRREGDRLSASSDLSGVDVPIGYHPPEDFLSRLPKIPSTPLLPRLIAQIHSADPSAKPEAILEEIAQVADHLGVAQPAAAFLVAWRRGFRDPALLKEYLDSLSSSQPAK